MYIEGQRTLPAQVERKGKAKDGTWLEVTMREGRKRQIRKVAARLGHPVMKLERIKLGPLELGDLPPGSWRRLTDEEVRALRKIRKQPKPPRSGRGRGPRPGGAQQRKQDVPRGRGQSSKRGRRQS
ncbi:MAG TPA: hypothetical protein PKI52_17235 [Aggregatilineales bacterium]|nr:hypothetical protein [Aggregatilineales bacterium]